MAERIVFEDGTTFECPVSPKAPVTPYSAGRMWKRIAVIGEIEAIKAAFVNGAKYSHEWDSIVYNEDGTETTEVRSEDLSAYCVAGEIIDVRDGSYTVLMGKKTETEIIGEKTVEQAKVIAILTGEVE